MAKQLPIPGALLMAQATAFKEKFGRAPGPDDPLFFDWDAETPEPLSTETLNRELKEAAAKVGVDVTDIPEDQLFDEIARALRV